MNETEIKFVGGGSTPKPLSPVASVVYAVLGSDTSITGLEGAADPAFELLKEIEGYACNNCNRLHEKPFCLIFTEELQCATVQPTSQKCVSNYVYIFPTGEIKMKVLHHIRRLLLFSPF